MNIAMLLRAWFLAFLLHISKVLGLKTVTYQRLNATVALSVKTCSQSVTALDSYIGARLKADDSTCEPLSMSWFDSATMEPGFVYYIKLKSMESFDTPHTGALLGYDFPVQFAAGSRLVITFKLAQGWNRFQVYVFDSAVSGGDYLSFIDEQILIMFKAFSWDDKTEFNQFSEGKWVYLYRYAPTMPFLQDEYHNLEFASLSDRIEVSVDGNYLHNLTHIDSPNAARKVELSCQAGLEVSKIQFFGVELE